MADRASIDLLEFADSRAGGYRVASLDPDGRLDACLMLAPGPELLPSRDWLGGLFAKPALDDCDRAALLAGRAPGGEDGGAIVCSCHGVGRNTLLKAIRDNGLHTPEALGTKLGAGTNCGSCLPEICSLIAESTPDSLLTGNELAQ